MSLALNTYNMGMRNIAKMLKGKLNISIIIYIKSCQGCKQVVSQSPAKKLTTTKQRVELPPVVNLMDLLLLMIFSFHLGVLC
jgi:hypothetical protein